MIKSVSFLILSIFFIGNVCSQNKDEIDCESLIKEAENLYNKKRYKLSLIKLNLAEKNNCDIGDSLGVVFKKNVNKWMVKNYICLKEYDKALKFLDEKSFIYYTSFPQDDSTKVEILKLKYGKKRIREIFKKELKVVKSLGIENYIYKVELKEINYVLKIRKLRREKNIEEYKSEKISITDLLKSSNLYQIIYE